MGRRGVAAVTGVLLRDVELGGERTDVRCAHGRITAIERGLVARAGERVIAGGGGALLPGLHDHHLHLLAMAAAARSVVLGPPDVDDAHDFARTLHRAAGAGGGAWVRAVGYHESVAGPLDRWMLDRMVPATPVRVQDRSGALWTLNSAGLTAIGLVGGSRVPTEPDGVERNPDGTPTGRIWRADSWLSARLPQEPPDLATVGRGLLARGVTGVTDATPVTDHSSLRVIAAAGLAVRIAVTGAPTLAPSPLDGVTWGPAKIVLEDHAPLLFDDVVAAVSAARRHGRAVAVHAVTAAAAALAVAAIEAVGTLPGDRIEHGAVIPLGLAESIARLGITVVTNPGFLRTRGDRYVVDVEPGERHDLWRCRSLVDGGVRVAAGSDAPFGPADPWLAMAAAVDRRTASGAAVGEGEGVSPSQALAMFLAPLHDPGGAPRRVDVGAVADLCLLTVPLVVALRDLAAVEVRTTVIGGAPGP
jgi:predicted amidohydrolase YtcJ